MEEMDREQAPYFSLKDAPDELTWAKDYEDKHINLFEEALD